MKIFERVAVCRLAMSKMALSLLFEVESYPVFTLCTTRAMWVSIRRQSDLSDRAKSKFEIEESQDSGSPSSVRRPTETIRQARGSVVACRQSTLPRRNLARKHRLVRRSWNRLRNSIILIEFRTPSQKSSVSELKPTIRWEGLICDSLPGGKDTGEGEVCELLVGSISR